MSYSLRRISIFSFQTLFVRALSLIAITIAVAAFAARPAFGQASASDKKENTRSDAAKTAPSKSTTNSGAKAKLPDPFADEATGVVEKPADKASDTRADKSTDTKPDKSSGKGAAKPEEPFAETPSKGRFDKKADSKPAKGPTDPFGDSTPTKTDLGSGADSDKSSKKSPDKTGKTEPALLPGADASKKSSLNPFEDKDDSKPGDKKPDDAKPSEMKSDEKKPTESGTEKQPQKPSDILLDTKTTEPPPSPGQAELKQGQDFIAAGKYTEAIEPLKKSIKLFPALPATDSAPVQYELGIAYRMLNRYDDAIKEFSEAIKTDPAIPDAMLRRGICWYYKDEYSLAQADFDEAAGINSNDPRPLTWKGMTLVKVGQIRDAITAYSEALRFDSRYVPAHINRGLAYISLREYGKAVADFDQAIRSTPDDASLFYKRGVAQAHWAISARRSSRTRKRSGSIRSTPTLTAIAAPPTSASATPPKPKPTPPARSS